MRAGLLGVASAKPLQRLGEQAGSGKLLNCRDATIFGAERNGHFNGSGTGSTGNGIDGSGRSVNPGPPRLSLGPGS